MSLRNDILDALTARLAAALPDAGVSRNAVLPDRLPAGGLVTVRDGDPGDPDIVLSPLSYGWQHRALMEAVVTGPTEADRAAALDDLLSAAGTALASDRSLGGLCDWVQPSGPLIEAVPVEGAAPVLGATVTIVLTYTTTDPLA